MVKNLPSIVGEAHPIPGQGAKIPHAAVQLIFHATTREPHDATASLCREKKKYCNNNNKLYHFTEGESHSVVFDSLRPHELYRQWNSPGQNTGVGSLSFLQGIFPTQGLNPGLPCCRWIPNQLSHKGNSKILERVA